METNATRPRTNLFPLAARLSHKTSERRISSPALQGRVRETPSFFIFTQPSAPS